MTRGNSLYVQGALAYQEGNRDRALAALQSALQVNPDLIMARFLLGNIYKEQGEYAAAVEQYERVVELDPYVASNHYNLGLVNHLLNRLQIAAASYLQALQLNPADMRSNMNLGLVYTALGKPEQAIAYAQKAMDLDPRSAEAAANLGVVLDARGEYAAAERAYRRAIELDSDRVETAINLAGNLVSQKRPKEAIAVYEQILRTTSNDSSLLRQRYGYALLQAERPDDAVRQFDLALKLNPQNYQAMNGMGDALLAQYRVSAMLDEKKRTAAVGYWKQSLALNPNQPRVAALIKEYAGAGLFP
jgi:tetratricopeptide (TPR) repeat protein